MKWSLGYGDGGKFTLGGAAVRGILGGVVLGALNYWPYGLGHGEAVVDAVLGSIALTLGFFAIGRTRPLLRRFANRNGKRS